MKNRIVLLSCLLPFLGVIGITVWGQVPEKKVVAVAEILNEKLSIEKKFYWAIVQNDEKSGLVSTDSRHQWSRFWMESELEVAKTQKGRIAAITAHLQRMEELDALTKKKATPVAGEPKATWLTEYYVLNAKLRLAKEKRQ